LLNQAAFRGQRISNAASALGNEAARELADALAQPFIVMGNGNPDSLPCWIASLRSRRRFYGADTRDRVGRVPINRARLLLDVRYAPIATKLLSAAK
jgi:hypothetical protein